MSIVLALCCTSAVAIPFGTTPFGGLIHSRLVPADMVVDVATEAAQQIDALLRQHPDAVCTTEGCVIEASLITLPDGRRLGTRMACGRAQGQLSCTIALETQVPQLQHNDRSRLLNLKLRLTGQTAESLYARLVEHPEAFNAAGSSVRERTLNLALLQRASGEPLIESRLLCAQPLHGGMVCVLKMEYQADSFPSSIIKALD